MVMDGYYSQDHLPKLRDKIYKQHLDYLSLEEVPAKHEIRLKLLDGIREYLLISSPDQKFFLPETSSVLYTSASTASFNGIKAAKGWDAIAKYASNLLSQPWRKEYKTIKTYSGYYKHSIEVNLEGAEQMFEVMGYKMADGVEFVLEEPVCPDQVTFVSIDALIAYEECQILSEIYKAIHAFDVKVTWLEILEFRDSQIWSPEDVVRAVVYSHQKEQYQKQRIYSNNAQAHLDQDNGGGYYNNVLDGGSLYTNIAKRGVLNGNNGLIAQQSQQLYGQESQYGNIGGHALPAACSFPLLRHHTQPQYYHQPFDYCNRYSQCTATNGLLLPHQMLPDSTYPGVLTMMYHPGNLMKQVPPCCSNGYTMPDMSVPSSAPITSSCLCNHPTAAISPHHMVPTGQLIDLDSSHPHQQQQMGHDLTDGLTTHNVNPRHSQQQMRTRNSTQMDYHNTQTAQSQRGSSTTYINGNNSSHPYSRNRDTAIEDGLLSTGSTGDKEVMLLRRDKEKVEEGSGTYEGWDYVYRNLESQGYNKDLGERGDILLSDRSGKRRISNLTIPKTAAELPEKLNGLTINSDKHHTITKLSFVERRNSDDTQNSYYDNVPSYTLQQQQTKPSVGSTKTAAQTTLMQQKMKTNKLSEVKAKVDSRRNVSGRVDSTSSGKAFSLVGEDLSSHKSNGRGDIGGTLVGLMSNGLTKRNKKQSPPLTSNDDTIPSTHPLKRISTTTTTPVIPLKSPVESSSLPPSTSDPALPANNSSPSSTNTWECSSCTYLNSANIKDICEMCSKSRDVALLDTSMEIGGPQCVSCTLVNPKGAAVCQVCDQTLNNSPTYI